ncbi:hypothetical protein QR680_014787 [Steinernema hermaphroditum]|uniref:dynamin GTPase n=1 Tax=Steinernema hermaphroditum TaxID=289476 RepID=A0AA39IA51_9BILA|nr:hypothetical protein QR680_014787 [Steinernema hermaphroditum]
MTIKETIQPPSDDYGQQLILLLNKFQDLSTKLGDTVLDLDLPQIAVVGVQSAGKSSILENFVGKDFLPRGSGVVTRRPLFLQLINDPEERGVFLHKPNEKFTDFNKIRMEIERETDRTTGSNKGISNVPINLKIYSPNVLNLTLVDLPGITRVAQGDQSQDIETVVREMILHYIDKPNCLILAVSPANTDLSTSDALLLAKKVDPRGERTIGVITKVDLMDAGTNAYELLRNRVLPLKRGYIGVVNRSQEGINSRVTMETAIQKERKFFRENYADIADRQGTLYLRQFLNRQLARHIHLTLPAMVDSVRRKQRVIADGLREFDDFPQTPRDKRRAITDLICRAVDRLEADLGNNLSRPGQVTDLRALNGGAEVKRMFTVDFAKEVDSTIMDKVTMTREICTAVMNTTGVRRGHFTAEKVFEDIVRQEIERLKAPSLKTAERVATRVTQVLRDAFAEIERYPYLKEFVLQETDEFIRKCEQKAIECIKHQFEYENALILTEHINLQTSEIMSAINWNVTFDANRFNGIGMNFTTFSVVQRTNSVIVNDSAAPIQNGHNRNYQFFPASVLRHYKAKDNGDKEELRLFYEGGVVPGKALQLVIDEHRSADDWLQAFQQVGFYAWLPNSGEDEFGSFEEYSRSDELTSRSVQAIRIMVEKYMEVELKTIKTIIPKIIVHMIVDKQEPFLRRDLLTDLQEHAESLLKEAPDVENQRKSLNEKMDMCKQIMELTKEMNSLAN